MLLFSRFQKPKQSSIECVVRSVLSLLLPFYALLYAVWQNDLGANPLEFITRNTGDWALYFVYDACDDAFASLAGIGTG